MICGNVNELLELNNKNTDAFPQYIKDYAKCVRTSTDSSARTSKQTALDVYSWASQAAKSSKKGLNTNFYE